ncbi:MAG: hypothetical protein EBX40_07390, partial [Gammaproteobacteria bacterium]|nr:hypothetical protein [Gammaproteobacteria bacterium]
SIETDRITRTGKPDIPVRHDIHTVTITPELRRAAMSDGFPLFSNRAGLTDPEGRAIDARAVAGQRKPGAQDRPLSRAEILSVIEGVTRAPIRAGDRANLPDRFDGGVYLDQLGRQEVHLRDRGDMDMLRHEMGHVAHIGAGQPDMRPPRPEVVQQLRRLTDVEAKTAGYPEAERPNEMFAEAVAAYARDPAEVKRRAPAVARWVRDTLNNSAVRKWVQFNVLPAVLAGAASAPMFSNRVPSGQIEALTAQARALRQERAAAGTDEAAFQAAHERLMPVARELERLTGHPLGLDDPETAARFGSDADFKPDQGLLQQASKVFGFTINPTQAGYILPNGRMLNFGEDGVRGDDHRAVSQLDGLSGDATGAMIEFMNRTGAARVDFNSGLFELSRKPTEVQLRAAVQAARRSGVPLMVEASRPDGSSRESRTFDRPTVEAVRAFFDEAAAGKAFYSNRTSAYHVSPYAFDRFDPEKIGTGEGA